MTDGLTELRIRLTLSGDILWLCHRLRGRWPTPFTPQVHGLMVTAASPAHLYVMRKSRQRLQNVLDRAKRLAEVRGCLKKENLKMTPVTDLTTPPPTGRTAEVSASPGVQPGPGDAGGGCDQH